MAHAAPAGHGNASQDELARLRGILFGGVVGEFVDAVTRLETRLQTEEAEIREELAKFEQRVEDRLVETDTRSSRSQADLRQQILRQSNALNDAVKERSAHAVRLANDGLQKLRNGKIDRSKLSSLLHDLASPFA